MKKLVIQCCQWHNGKGILHFANAVIFFWIMVFIGYPIFFVLFAQLPSMDIYLMVGIPWLVFVVLALSSSVWLLMMISAVEEMERIDEEKKLQRYSFVSTPIQISIKQEK